jgi:hypothetical protein
LEHAPRHPDHAAVLSDLDPELDGLPLGVPVDLFVGKWLGLPTNVVVLPRSAAATTGTIATRL